MANNHERYLQLAKTLSYKSTHYQYQMGCVIVKKNRIVGVGFNQLKSHPKSLHEWKMTHAELHAVLGVKPKDLYGATVYVYREYSDGSPALAKPCKSCESMLRNCNIKRVCFTDVGGYKIIDF